MNQDGGEMKRTGETLKGIDELGETTMTIKGLSWSEHALIITKLIS